MHTLLHCSYVSHKHLTCFTWLRSQRFEAVLCCYIPWEHFHSWSFGFWGDLDTIPRKKVTNYLLNICCLFACISLKLENFGLHNYYHLKYPSSFWHCHFPFLTTSSLPFFTLRALMCISNLSANNYSNYIAFSK